jgi:hypothetical protein
MIDKLTQAMALLDDVASRISATDAYQRGRIAERIMIVAWLRDTMPSSMADLNHEADAIEAGDHLK